MLSFFSSMLLFGTVFFGFFKLYAADLCTQEWVAKEIIATTDYPSFSLNLQIQHFTGIRQGQLAATAEPPRAPNPQAAMRYNDALQVLYPQALLINSRFDGRSRVSNTDCWPMSVHTQITVNFDDEEYGCSGVMVGPSHLLTAAHCVYDPRRANWARSIKVHPGLDGQTAPFGRSYGVKVYTYKAWTEDSNPEWDLALVILDQPIGNRTGWAGLIRAPDEAFQQESVSVTGYPGDKGMTQMWTMASQLRTVQAETLSYSIDTYGGQSGGAVWLNKDGNPYIVGIHAYGGTDRNHGVRISLTKLCDVALWIHGATHWTGPKYSS